MIHDTQNSISKINVKKGHILTVINQEAHKTDILQQLDENTCLIIIDFAMKYLAKKYRESMSSWFGKERTRTREQENKLFFSML